MKRPSRLSDPVTGALIDPETGEWIEKEVVRKATSALRAGLLKNDDGSLHDPFTGITCDVCDVEASGAELDPSEVHQSPLHGMGADDA